MLNNIIVSHIFERFYRVDRSRHKAIDGTGLGLSIVKHGVLFHGGKVRVYSTVGQGTEFILKFPKMSECIQDSTEDMWYNNIVQHFYAWNGNVLQLP